MANQVSKFMALTGYLYVFLAATCWGISGIAAKWMFLHEVATPVTVSQTRVFVGWIVFLSWVLLRNPRALLVPWRDLWRFALLGVIGVAGANFGLYFAISHMSAAIADVIQFTAPAMVAAWMWMRREEPFELRAMFALLLTTVGVVFALGLLEQKLTLSLPGVISAFGSALSYAFLMVWGKHLGRRYDQIVILHYAMLTATAFWAFVHPPTQLLPLLSASHALMLVGFGILSIAIPYFSFFAGLRRVLASRAGIVSTLEPVVMAVGAWAILGEALHSTQVLGFFMVIGGVVLVQLSAVRNGRDARHSAPQPSDTTSAGMPDRQDS
jgi:drug/metabolite transporter (DMT)-like permease